MPVALRRAVATAIPCLLVAGCMTGTRTSAAQPADAMAPPSEQTCHADPVQRFIGQRFDEGALRKASGAGDLRVVHPGEAISMLFMNGRLTVYVDDKGLVTALSCS